MIASRKKRLREGALSALRTPQNLPDPPTLIPLGESGNSGNSKLVDVAVAKMRARDPEGVHYAYIRFSENVFRYLASFVPDRREAQEITLEVFGKLMPTIDRYPEQGVPLEIWLLQIARNLGLDRLRAMRSGKTEALERGTALRKALEELPDDQREVLVLRHLVGLSLDEIAGKFEMPTDAVAGLDQKAWRALETTGHPGGSQVVETLLIAELEQLSNQMD